MSSQQRRFTRVPRALGLVAAAATLALLAAGCSTGGGGNSNSPYGFKAAKQDNKTLFDQFGYKIPETWEDYQALGDKLAAEHPGYTLGTIGDSFTATLTDFWSGQAPIYTVKGKEFTANFADSHTKKMVALLDH